LSASLNVDELALKSESELTERVNATLSRYKMLCQIYDSGAVLSIVRKHEDPDNYLLWLLASHGSSADNIVEAVDGSLVALERFGAVSKFASKLKQHETVKVKSVLPELFVPRGFAELGFDIQFEPSILGTMKNPDFKASRGTVEIFVEITNLLEAEIERMNKVRVALRRRLRSVPERYVFRLRVPQDLEMSEVPQVVSFVRASLRSIGSGFSSGSKYYFSRVRGEQVVLTVQVASPRGYGHLGGMLSTRTSKLQPSEIASKISKKTQQLPKDSKSMIVVCPTDPTMERDEIEDALYGTPIPSFDTNTGDFVGTRRDERRVFRESRNTRVSAVGFYTWSAFNKGMITSEMIYHNPFAARPIDPSLLARKGVEQFVPQPAANDSVEMKWL